MHGPARRSLASMPSQHLHVPVRQFTGAEAMNTAVFYALIGVGLFTSGLYALIIHTHLLRKILAINIMGSGVFLALVALATRTEGAPDPVSHAMVITGIVVAISATALALALMLRLHDATGRAELPEEQPEEQPEEPMT